MEELSIEQKAKAYDKALKEAVIAHKDEDRHLKATLERIFPELKESEDEKIRKEIISALKYANHKGVYDKHLAWLEKQKEFVSTDFDNVWEWADCDELTAPLEKYSKDAIKKMCHAWYDKGIELERKRCLGKQDEQKSPLSEQDKELITAAICFIDNNNHDNEFACNGIHKEDVLKWLKSLKQRITE